MRISLVTETFPPEINGVAMTLARLVEGLRGRGHQVAVARPERPDLEPPAAGEVRVPGLPIPGYPNMRMGLPYGWRLRQHWLAERPDVVHVATEGPLGAAAILTASALRLPVTSSFHTRFDHYCRHYRMPWLERPVRAWLRHLHNRAQATLVPTRALAERLRDQGFKSVRVLSRGVDTRLFHPGHRDESLRRAWGVGPDSLVSLYVGRIAAEKNLDLVFDTQAALRARHPDCRLILVGEGPRLDALRARHPEALFAGPRRGLELARHYASADLFLFPSLSETYGNVTQEAMASGLPVLAYAEAAAAELIREGHNGRLVSPGDAAAFVDAAAALADDAAVRTRLAGAARESVLARDWSEVVNEFEAVLRAAARGQAMDVAEVVA